MNKFSFLLESFALQNLKPKLFKGGQVLDVKDDEAIITASGMEDADANMTTAKSGKQLLSMLGTPVFSDIILQTRNGNTRMPLLDALITVDRTKVIVKTLIVGKGHTVKEHISNGDYNIRIMGRLTQPFSKDYPRAQMADMIALCESDEALKVTSEYLQMFGIYELVVEQPSFPQREGFQNIQLFDLNCSSDQPVQLQRRAR